MSAPVLFIIQEQWIREIIIIIILNYDNNRNLSTMMKNKQKLT